MQRRRKREEKSYAEEHGHQRLGRIDRHGSTPLVTVCALALPRLDEPGVGVRVHSKYHEHDNKT